MRITRKSIEFIEVSGSDDKLECVKFSKLLIRFTVLSNCSLRLEGFLFAIEYLESRLYECMVTICELCEYNLMR